MFFPIVYYCRQISRFRKTCPLIEKEKCTPQHVVTVELIAKCHSNQEKTDLFIAENASKTINLHQDKVVEDLVATGALDLVEEMTDHVKCMMQNVVTVELIAKCHSNQEKTDLFIAENASKTTNKIRKPF